MRGARSPRRLPLVVSRPSAATDFHRRLRELTTRWRFEAHHADPITAELLNALASLVDANVDAAFILSLDPEFVTAEIRRVLRVEQDPINQIILRSPQTGPTYAAMRRELEAELSVL